jgi:hypothetical protein
LSTRKCQTKFAKTNLILTRYPFHIQPYWWLYNGWNTTLKLFQHSEKMKVSHCRLVFQQVLPTSDAVLHSWFLKA